MLHVRLAEFDIFAPFDKPVLPHGLRVDQEAVVPSDRDVVAENIGAGLHERNVERILIVGVLGVDHTLFREIFHINAGGIMNILDLLMFLRVPVDVIDGAVKLIDAADGLRAILFHQRNDGVVVVRLQNLTGIFQRDVEPAAAGDDVQHPELVERVIAVAVSRADEFRLKQPDLIVKAQRVLGNAGDAADLSDCILLCIQCIFLPGTPSFVRPRGHGHPNRFPNYMIPCFIRACKDDISCCTTPNWPLNVSGPRKRGLLRRKSPFCRSKSQSLTLDCDFAFLIRQ